MGSFAAGVMISTTDLAQHTLEQVRLYVLNCCYKFRGIHSYVSLWKQHDCFAICEFPSFSFNFVGCDVQVYNGPGYTFNVALEYI